MKKTTDKKSMRGNTEIMKERNKKNRMKQLDINNSVIFFTPF